MTVQNYFILTEAQRVAARGFNSPELQIDPRAVDNGSPGTGLNLNDQAAEYSPGDPVALTGMFVAPKRIVDDPDYIQNVPEMVAYLLTLPWASLEDETIFAPVVVDI